MRWVGHTLAGLLAVGTLGVAVAGGVLWLLGSQSGTTWLFAHALARTGPALTVGRVSGTLLGGFVLDDVRLRLPRDELDIPRLALEWDPAAALLGDLAFRAARAGPVVYRRLPPTGAESSGAVPALPFKLRLDDAVAESLRFEVGDGALQLAETRVAATYQGRHLTLSHATSAWGPAELAGDGDIRLDDGIAIAAEIAWSGPALGVDAAGRVTIAGVWPLLTVHHELTAPFGSVADGELDFTSTLRADLTVAWQDLFIPGVPRLTSPLGNVKVVGGIGDYRYEGTGTLDVDGRAASFTAAGTGRAGEVTFDQLALDAFVDSAAAGSLLARGSISLAEQGSTLALEARDFDPRWIHPQFPGRLSGTAALHTVFAPSFDARFADADLAGELRGYAVTIRGAAEVTGGNRWRLEGLSLDSGPNHAALDGTLDETELAVTVTADVDQLDLLLPGVVGGVTGNVSFAGPWLEPRGSGRFEARGLAIDGYSAARLAVRGEAGLAAGTPLMLTIEAGGLARGPVEVNDARLAFEGTTSALRATLEASADDWRARAAASGGVASLTWRGSIDALEIDERVLGDWRLLEPARASAGRAGVTLATSCLEHESGARWCAGLELDGGADDQLVLSAQNFHVETLKPLLPPQLNVAGIYQLSASLFDLSGEPHGAAVLTGGTTRMSVAVGAEQAFETDLEDFRASATLDTGRLQLNASVRSSKGGSTEIDARIDDVRKSDSTIAGSVAVQSPDVGFLAALSPDVGQVGGKLAVDLGIGGTVDAPTVDGRAAYSDGRVTVPQWGLVVDRIHATATSADGRALAFDATGYAGDGELRLTGTTSLDPAQGWPTRLELKGEGVKVVQLADAEIFATPDLDIDVALPDVRVTGDVLVPRAAIKLSELPAQAVAPSPDAIVHGATATEVERPLRLTTNIQLVLGDDVRYNGLNLATRVSGGLRLDAEAGRSAVASGTLTLAGTYNAYGQVLELERGQLLFNGPLDDPGLDVRAARTIESTIGSPEPIRVGVELAGRLKSPRTRVISTPAMTEADALSYLLLGRPVTGTGSEETTTLQTAAISMGLQQALPAVQKIGQTLGLDELSVQTTDTDPGALMAGKYLSPKVYIRYSYGLFNRIGGLLLRFKVNNRLSIETRSGDQESMDFLYTVEKD